MCVQSNKKNMIDLILGYLEPASGYMDVNDY